ncbi:hypothetical protein CKA27_25050 [Vibrio coralliilyticus]|nr:hypothetical protein CKA27_25050 [Vibrio coralliilyticus]
MLRDYRVAVALNATGADSLWKADLGRKGGDFVVSGRGVALRAFSLSEVNHSLNLYRVSFSLRGYKNKKGTRVVSVCHLSKQKLSKKC